MPLLSIFLYFNFFLLSFSLFPHSSSLSFSLSHLPLSFSSFDHFSLDGEDCNGGRKVLGYEVYVDYRRNCKVEGALTSQVEISRMVDGVEYIIQVWYVI